MCYPKNMKGQVMLLTVLIVSGTILGATTIAGLLMLYQMRQATDFGKSVQALFAADTGLEWSLYRKFAETEAGKNYPKPTLSPETDADFEVTVSSSSIRSVGCVGAVQDGVADSRCPRPITRAFEIIFK
jgi:hypothetical protein